MSLHLPPSCPQWCLDIRHYLRSSEKDLKKAILREKLCSSLLLISFLSCARAKKEIKLLPARSNVKPWPLQHQDCYLSFCSSARNLYMAFTSALTREGYKLHLLSPAKAPATTQNDPGNVIVWRCDGLIAPRWAGARAKEWPSEMCICHPQSTE